MTFKARISSFDESIGPDYRRLEVCGMDRQAEEMENKIKSDSRQSLMWTPWTKKYT
jgi:hypothetical protein